MNIEYRTGARGVDVYLDGYRISADNVSYEEAEQQAEAHLYRKGLGGGQTHMLLRKAMQDHIKATAPQRNPKKRTPLTWEKPNYAGVYRAHTKNVSFHVKPDGKKYVVEAWWTTDYQGTGHPLGTYATLAGAKSAAEKAWTKMKNKIGKAPAFGERQLRVYHEQADRAYRAWNPSPRHNPKAPAYRFTKGWPSGWDVWEPGLSRAAHGAMLGHVWLRDGMYYGQQQAPEVLGPFKNRGLAAKACEASFRAKYAGRFGGTRHNPKATLLDYPCGVGHTVKFTLKGRSPFVGVVTADDGRYVDVKGAKDSAEVSSSGTHTSLKLASTGNRYTVLSYEPAGAPVKVSRLKWVDRTAQNRGQFTEEAELPERSGCHLEIRLSRGMYDLKVVEGIRGTSAGVYATLEAAKNAAKTVRSSMNQGAR